MKKVLITTVVSLFASTATMAYEPQAGQKVRVDNKRGTWQKCAIGLCFTKAKVVVSVKNRIVTVQEKGTVKSAKIGPKTKKGCYVLKYRFKASSQKRETGYLCPK